MDVASVAEMAVAKHKGEHMQGIYQEMAHPSAPRPQEAYLRGHTGQERRGSHGGEPTPPPKDKHTAAKARPKTARSRAYGTKVGGLGSASVYSARGKPAW